MLVKTTILFVIYYELKMFLNAYNHLKCALRNSVYKNVGQMYQLITCLTSNIIRKPQLVGIVDCQQIVLIIKILIITKTVVNAKCSEFI